MPPAELPRRGSHRTRGVRAVVVLVLVMAVAVAAGWLVLAVPGMPEANAGAAVGPVPASALPFDPRTVPGTQVVFVTGRQGSSYGRLELWMRWQTGWYRNFSVPARLGSAGISAAYREGLSYTPAGMFTIGDAFGRLPSPGTGLRYRHVGTGNRWWWVSDPRSRWYNQPRYCAPSACPFRTWYGENLGTAGAVYDYALVMDVNRRPVVPGRGSAFFLHIGNGRATAGCVAADRTTVRTLVRTLQVKARPVIIVKVT